MAPSTPAASGARLLVAIGLASLSGCDDCQPKTALPPVRPRHVVLILVDTLRADHLSAFGYPPETTPNLTRLAERGARFSRCISQAPWTTPATASLLSSLHPSAHTANLQDSRMPDSVLTLAEVLADAGMTTQGFVSGHFARGKFGLAQGFADYDESHVYGRNRVTTHDLEASASAWIEAHASEPFFLFLQFYEPHYNYAFHREYAFGPAAQGRVVSNLPIERIKELGASLTGDELATLIGYYDGEIRMVDQAVASLMEKLASLGLADDTLVVLTGDHGEHFGEHGLFGHEQSIYDPLVHVPLIVAGPGVPPAGEIKGVVGTIDVAPTILELLGQPVPAAFQGTSLVPLLAGDDRERPAVQIAETFKEIRQQAVAAERWLLIRNESNRGRAPLELFDLGPDGQREANVVAREPGVVRELFAALIEHEERLGASPVQAESRQLDAEEMELLRALGYVGGAAPGESRAARIAIERGGDRAEAKVPVGSVRLVLNDFWELEESRGRLFVWSKARSSLSLYGLEPGRRYRVTVELKDAAGRSKIGLGRTAEDATPVPISPARTASLPRPLKADARGAVDLAITTPTWRPKDRDPSSADERQLGVCLRRVVVREAAD